MEYECAVWSGVPNRSGSSAETSQYECAVWSGVIGVIILGLQKLQDRFCRENQVKLPPVQARFNYLTLLLFFKIKTSSRLRIYNAYCLKLAVSRHAITCAVINSRYQQGGRPVHWKLFFQDRSFCGMTCPQTFSHWELLRRRIEFPFESCMHARARPAWRSHSHVLGTFAKNSFLLWT